MGHFEVSVVCVGHKCIKDIIQHLFDNMKKFLNLEYGVSDQVNYV